MLFSCGGGHAAVNPNERAPVDALLKPAELRKAMSGTGLVTETRKGKSVTIPAVVLVEWPDKLRIELQDPLGATLRLLVINGDRFWLYQNQAKENLMGPLKSLPLEFRLPFTSDDLVRVFLARPRWEAFRDLPLSEAHHVQRKTVHGSEEVSWDPSAMTPEDWKETFPSGTSVTAEFREFAFKDGARYPTKIWLRGPTPEISVLLAWKDWEASVPQGKNLFQIPAQRDFGRPTKELR